MARRRVSNEGSETTARAVATTLRASRLRFEVVEGQGPVGKLIRFPYTEPKQDPYSLKTRTQLYSEGAKGDDGALKELERREDAEALRAIADGDLLETRATVLEYYNRAVVKRTAKTLLKETTETEVLLEIARGKINGENVSSNIRLGAVEELERRSAIFELYLVAKNEGDSELGQQAEEACYRAVAKTIISRRMSGEVEAFRAALDEGRIKTEYVPTAVVGNLDAAKLKRAMQEIRIIRETNNENRSNALRLVKIVVSQRDENTVLRDLAIGRITPQNSIQFKVAAVHVLAERNDYFKLREVVEHTDIQIVRSEADRLSEQMLAQNFDHIVAELTQRKGWAARVNRVKD